MVGVTVDLPLSRGVVVGVDDSELLPPLTTVGTTDGDISSVDTASCGCGGGGGGTGTRGACAAAAKREVALAERNPSDRRRFIMG